MGHGTRAKPLDFYIHVVITVLAWPQAFDPQWSVVFQAVSLEDDSSRAGSCEGNHLVIAFNLSLRDEIFVYNMKSVYEVGLFLAWESR